MNLAKLIEERIAFPYFDMSTMKSYDCFEDYYNDLFNARVDLINVQLLVNSIDEAEYIFWYKEKE